MTKNGYGAVRTKYSLGKRILIKTNPLAIPDLVLLEIQVIGDKRKLFFESLNHARSKDAIGIRWPSGFLPHFSNKVQASLPAVQAEEFA